MKSNIMVSFGVIWFLIGGRCADAMTTPSTMIPSPEIVMEPAGENVLQTSLRDDSNNIVDIFKRLVNKSAERIVQSDFMVQLMKGKFNDSKIFIDFKLNDLYYLSYGAANFATAKEKRPIRSNVLAYLMKQSTSYLKYFDRILKQESLEKYKDEIHNGENQFPPPWGKWKVAQSFVDYVHFLQEVAKDEDPFFTIISNAPCCLLWPALGKKMDVQNIPMSNPYAKFMKANFGEWSWKAEEVVKNNSGFYDRERLINIFKKGLDHEEEIFQPIYNRGWGSQALPTFIVELLPIAVIFAFNLF